MEKKCEVLEGTIKELKENQAPVQVKIQDRYKESTLGGGESRFQSVREGPLPKERSERRDPLYEITLGELPRRNNNNEQIAKAAGGDGRKTDTPKSVYNVDLEKYNQMMRVGGRVPGTISKK